MMRQVVLILMIVPMMLQGIEIEIHRNMTCKDGSTKGVLYINGKEVGRTLELPWKNNEAGISRIPLSKPGKPYQAKMRNDKPRGFRIELLDVQDRKYIQIHVGNYPSQIEGCILVGDDVTHHNGQCMVTNSAQTITKIRELIAKSAEDEYMQMTHGNVDIKVIVE